MHRAFQTSACALAAVFWWWAPPALAAEEARTDAKTDAKTARREGPVLEGPLLVVVDPGHGGPFPHDGAHGPRGLVEKTLVLQVARRLKAVLEDAGATVLLTRDDDTDVSLADRARQANENGADLFISIHCNSMATPHDRAMTRGAETYFLSPDPTDAEAKLLAEMENGGPGALPVAKTGDAVSGLLADLALGQARNDSAALAQALHRNLIRRTGLQSRGVRQAPFLVLSGTKMPSALVEIGFISHPQEARLLAKEKHQQRVAEALAAGIEEFNNQVLARRLFPPTPEEKAALAEERARSAKARAAAAAGSLAVSPAVSDLVASSVSTPISPSVSAPVSGAAPAESADPLPPALASAAPAPPAVPAQATTARDPAPAGVPGAAAPAGKGGTLDAEVPAPPFLPTTSATSTTSTSTTPTTPAPSSTLP